MELKPQSKIGIILLLLVLLFSIEVFRNFVVYWQNRPEYDSNCIWDPLHSLLTPLSSRLESRDIIKKLLLAIDSLFIDITIFFLGLTWAIHGRTKSFFPSLLIFYIIRGIILNVGKWPLPKVYLFEDPGLPSMFVDYDRTNDLFFSGHCGGISVMLTDSILNKRYKLTIFHSILLVYTFCVLAVEGGHYTNDMIIGSIAGFTICRAYFEVRMSAALFYMRNWGRLLKFLLSIGWIMKMYELSKEKKRADVGIKEATNSEQATINADSSNLSLD
jgi:hypothetical protein